MAELTPENRREFWYQKIIDATPSGSGLPDPEGDGYILIVRNSGEWTQELLTSAISADGEIITENLLNYFPEYGNIFVPDNDGTATTMAQLLQGLVYASVGYDNAPLSTMIPAVMNDLFRGFCSLIALHSNIGGRVILRIGQPINDVITLSVRSSDMIYGSGVDNYTYIVLLEGPVSTAGGGGSAINQATTAKFLLYSDEDGSSISVFGVDTISFTEIPFPSM